MKLEELFDSYLAEANYSPPWTRSGHFKAQIEFGAIYDAINYKKIQLDDNIDKNTINALEKEAREKFKKAKDSSSNKFRFENIDEAKQVTEKLDINWPLVIITYRPEQPASRRMLRIIIKKIIDISKVNPNHTDVRIEKQEDGSYKVYTSANQGEPRNFVRQAAYDCVKAKLKVKSLKGKIWTKPYEAYLAAPTGFLVLSDNEAKIKSIVEKAIEKVKKEAKNKADHKELVNSPEYKKKINQEKYQVQKARKEALYAKYGKDIVDRVKVKPMSWEGDDGYQWALFVDGKRIKSGMTQYQAAGEERIYWEYLLKLSKMTPEELKKEKEASDGVRAYFLVQALEKQLPVYLKQIDNNVKMTLSSKEKAEKEYKDLIDRLSGRSSI